MRVVIVQPPRMYWPYTSEGDNFLLQQALPALAAVLRAERVSSPITHESRLRQSGQ